MIITIEYRASITEESAPSMPVMCYVQHKIDTVTLQTVSLDWQPWEPIEPKEMKR